MKRNETTSTEINGFGPHSNGYSTNRHFDVYPRKAISESTAPRKSKSCDHISNIPGFPNSPRHRKNRKPKHSREATPRSINSLTPRVLAPVERLRKWKSLFLKKEKEKSPRKESDVVNLLRQMNVVDSKKSDGDGSKLQLGDQPLEEELDHEKIVKSFRKLINEKLDGDFRLLFHRPICNAISESTLEETYREISDVNFIKSSDLVEQISLLDFTEFMSVSELLWLINTADVFNSGVISMNDISTMLEIHATSASTRMCDQDHQVFGAPFLNAFSAGMNVSRSPKYYTLHAHRIIGDDNTKHTNHPDELRRQRGGTLVYDTEEQHRLVRILNESKPPSYSPRAQKHACETRVRTMDIPRSYPSSRYVITQKTPREQFDSAKEDLITVTAYPFGIVDAAGCSICITRSRFPKKCSSSVKPPLHRSGRVSHRISPRDTFYSIMTHRLLIKNGDDSPKDRPIESDNLKENTLCHRIIKKLQIHGCTPLYGAPRFLFCVKQKRTIRNDIEIQDRGEYIISGLELENYVNRRGLKYQSVAALIPKAANCLVHKTRQGRMKSLQNLKGLQEEFASPKLSERHSNGNGSHRDYRSMENLSKLGILPHSVTKHRMVYGGLDRP